MGTNITIADIPLYSWTSSPSRAKSFGAGGVVTRADVPIKSVVLSDRTTETGTYEQEREIVFIGGPDFTMKVIQSNN